MKKAVLATAILALFTGSSFAEDTATTAAPQASTPPSASSPMQRRAAMRERAAERLKAADKNNDGELSKSETANMPRLNREFDEIDSNHDGQLSREEIRAHAQQQRGQRKPRGAARADKDKDGKLSKEEVGQFPRLSQDFDNADTNHDGYLSREELQAHRAKMQASKPATK